MTVWAEGPTGEAKNDEFDRVQIEFGSDEKDVWLVFNRKVSAVVMTREEAKQLVFQMVDLLDREEIQKMMLTFLSFTNTLGEG
jgi:hypothetical protein